MKLRTSKKGFTIIEVVIVLAIAGLIFAIVFWALPNLQKNQRDNTRRTIASNIMANLEQHAANANGRYPTTASEYWTFLNTFYDCGITGTGTTQTLSDSNCTLQDPLANFVVSFGSTTAMTTSDAIGTMRVATSAGCGTSPGQFQVFSSPAQPRAFALMIKLENGVAYCISNTN